jgi:Fe-Mn family superoxide dismutase
MAFTLPELEFKYDALEPFIDEKTMRLHYSKHHASYLKKFNAAIAGTELDKMKPEEIFSTVSNYSGEVRNNGGGYFNHSLFWKVLTPQKTEITDIHLADNIIMYFGNLKFFKDEFFEEGMKLFGSGWVWLIKKMNNELLITTSANQDNPLMDIAPIKGKPILALDLWEHAYYLKYKNDRAAYINSFWDAVNWKNVAELFHNENIIF